MFTYIFQIQNISVKESKKMPKTLISGNTFILNAHYIIIK